MARKRRDILSEMQRIAAASPLLKWLSENETEAEAGAAPLIEPKSTEAAPTPAPAQPKQQRRPGGGAKQAIPQPMAAKVQEALHRELERLAAQPGPQAVADYKRLMTNAGAADFVRRQLPKAKRYLTDKTLVLRVAGSVLAQRRISDE